MTVERFTGKRPSPTIHDVDDLFGVINEFRTMDGIVCFAAAGVDSDGNFKTRWIVLPSGHQSDLFSSVSILHRDILNELGDE